VSTHSMIDMRGMSVYSMDRCQKRTHAYCIKYEFRVWCIGFLSILVAPYCKVYWVDHKLHMIYAYLRPSFNLNFTPTLSLSVIFELAPIYEEGSYSIPSINAGYFFSWEIAPKSWLYVVTNELYERTEKGKFNPLSHVSAIKLKWLYLF